LNPLVCIPSPRDLPEFEHFISKITKYDKYFAKYFYEIDAYNKLRDYFLTHTEYTHLVLCADDLLVTNEAFDILIKDIEEFDYPVVSGICNLTYIELNKSATTLDIPGTAITDYNFITKEQIELWRNNGEYIHQVRFNGFALCFIRRDIVERCPFRGGQGLDRQFGIDCNKENIPMYVDIRAESFHIKFRMGFGMYEKMFVREKPTQCIFTPKTIIDATKE
jgi:hypothetical protein